MSEYDEYEPTNQSVDLTTFDVVSGSVAWAVDASAPLHCRFVTARDSSRWHSFDAKQSVRDDCDGKARAAVSALNQSLLQLLPRASGSIQGRSLVSTFGSTHRDREWSQTANGTACGSHRDLSAR